MRSIDGEVIQQKKHPPSRFTGKGGCFCFIQSFKPYASCSSPRLAALR